jgi:hypothetical protein
MSLTADEGQKPGCELAGDQSGAKRIRQRVCKMSDAELLRFGMIAKYMCSQEANPEHPSPQDFALQLNEAQREWNKRFTKLPLVTTFGQDER